MWFGRTRCCLVPAAAQQKRLIITLTETAAASDPHSPVGYGATAYRNEQILALLADTRPDAIKVPSTRTALQLQSLWREL